MSTRTYRRLSAAEFDKASRTLRLSDQNTQLARAVMVEGVTSTAVASAAGVARQTVQRAVRKVYDAHLQAMDLPEDWRRINVIVPPAMAEKITAMAADAAAAHHQKQALSSVMEFSHARKSDDTH